MRKFLAITIPLLLTVACKTTHNTTASQQNKTPAPSLKKENIYSLVSKLKANKYDYKWITAHFSFDMDEDSSHTSFSGTIRMRKDSVIWMSIAPLLGIEAARVMLTQDSAMTMDRLHDTYFKGDYDYINSRLADDIDFELIQSVMVGSNVEFYNDTAKMKSYFDGSQYLISTIRRRKLKRILYHNSNYRSKSDAQFIWLDPQDYHITHVRLEDFVNHRTFDAYYSDFQKVDSVMFPFHIRYEIVAEKKIRIDLQYKKVAFKLQEETPFTIPKKYERVQY